MNLFGRDRCQQIEILPAKCHARTRHNWMLQQHIYRAAPRELDLFTTMKGKAGPKASTQPLRIVIDKVGIAETRNYFARSQESLFEPPEFMSVPNIILIRQCDNCTVTKRNRFLEVLRRAEMPIIDHNPSGEPCAPSKLLYDFNRSIRRTVITNYEFIWKPILRADAL
jgi:hypothetical protein